MKQILFLLLLIFIFDPCIGQRKIKKLDVVEKGYNVKLNFEPVNDKFIFNQAEVKIIPISGDELNEMFLDESNVNGKFEYSFYDNSRSSHFLKKKKKVNVVSEVESDFDFLILGLDWLLENDKINEKEFEELEKQLILYFDYEKGKQSYYTDDIILGNPYYINNKYLSVFKIEFTNPTNSFVTFDKKIFLQSGNLIYSPLSKDFILEELQRTLYNPLYELEELRRKALVDKSLILEKFNLHDTVIIPPHSKVVKFFAVTPIKYYNKKLEISFPGIDKKLLWSISTDEKIIDEKYTYYELKLDWAHDRAVTKLGNVFSILTGNHTSIFLGDNEIFIGDDSLNEKFEVFTISLWGNSLFFGRNSDLQGADYIDFGKVKRNSITIQLERMLDIKRK